MSVVLPTRLPRDFLFEVGMGRVPGYRRIIASGVNPDVDTGTIPEDIWFAGGLYPLPSAATTLEALSSSADDASAGTGLRTMLVGGLDANYAEISETVTLNGTTPVALSNSYLRINSCVIASAGSGGVNAGNITIRETGGGQTRCAMRAGYGIARQCVYTVPAGYTLGVNTVTYNVLRLSTASCDATFATLARSPSGHYRMAQEFAVTAVPFQHFIEVVAPVAEKWDFLIRCTGVSDSNLEVSAAFTGVLIDNDYL